jgi:hypothetical protein
VCCGADNILDLLKDACCAPSVPGGTPALDKSGACCPSGVVNKCGVCDGPLVAVKSDDGQQCCAARSTPSPSPSHGPAPASSSNGKVVAVAVGAVVAGVALVAAVAGVVAYKSVQRRREVEQAKWASKIPSGSAKAPSSPGGMGTSGAVPLQAPSPAWSPASSHHGDRSAPASMAPVRVRVQQAPQQAPLVVENPMYIRGASPMV